MTKHTEENSDHSSQSLRRYTIKHPRTGEDYFLRYKVNGRDAVDLTCKFLREVNEIEGDDARPDLEEAYEAARLVLGDGNMTEREDLISAACFALGMTLGREMITYPQLDVLREHVKNTTQAKSTGGGQTPNTAYKSQIIEVLKKYGSKEIRTQDAACAEIDKFLPEGKHLTTSTFSDWWQEFDDSGDLFKKSGK